ncbi:putative uncharacterized protein DDB_G0274405 [Mytilus trossulus]|uniref:putative uncharacterized protein DDB_G0274405 n=1 Tax=Mytilus trossulus TaxID=6551 RepID=UPI003007D3D5
MASSSVSQESLDTVDYEQSARKSKIRSLRAKGVLPRSSEREADPNDKENGDEGFSGEHESPSRGGVGRAKDKRTRPSHLKGKMGLKDKRKLREKRRSTGVVHLQSTESTDDTLDDEDIVEEGTELKTVSETKKNTSYNEAFSVEGRRHRTNDVARKAALYNERVDDNQPQSPSDRFGGRSAYNAVRNKSPSDLEADLEDNQDYDSTVSHSETNLSVIGKSESTDSNTYSPKTSRPPNSVYSRISPSDPTLSTYKPSSPRNNLLWESPRTNKQSSPSSDHDTKTTHTVLNRFPFAANQNQNKDSDQSNKPKSFPSVLSRFPQSNHDQENKSQSNIEKDSQKQSYHDSSQFRSTYRDLDSKSRTHDVETKTKSPPSYRSNHGNTENQTGSHHREKFIENLNSSNQRRYPRHNFEDSSSKLDEERAKFKEEKTKLEKKLDEEREENRQLKSMLETRDQKIVELEREIYCLNKDLEDLDEDYQKLQVENHALIRTVSQLSTRV